MTYKYRTIPILLLAAIAAASLAAAGPRGDNKRSQEPPELVTFSLRYPPAARWTWRGEHQYTLSAIDRENGREFAEFALEATGSGERPSQQNYRVEFGRLYEGDVIPMFTALYRVTDVDTKRNEMTVKRIDESKWLEEIGLNPESYALPSKALVRLGIAEFQVIIWRPRDDGKALRTADVTASYEVRTETGALREINLAFRSVRVGDSIEVADSKYNVRKIVVPDSKRQIVGWVELTPIRDKNGAKNDTGKATSVRPQ